MKLYADASVYGAVVRALRALGLDIMSACQDLPAAADPEILARAAALGRILITEDKDFGALVIAQRLPARGVILLRTTPTSEAEAEAVALRVAEVVEQADGAFVTVTDERVRKRPLA